MPLGPEVKTTKAKNPTNRTAPRMKMAANNVAGRRVRGPSGGRPGGLCDGLGGVGGVGGVLLVGSVKDARRFGKRPTSRGAAGGYPILRAGDSFPAGLSFPVRGRTGPPDRRA